jgi:uncharacterized protein YjbI with pentapeptide repeats
MQQSELDELMALHELWITSFGKQGKQLWFEDADLSGFDFSGRILVDSYLPCVNLDGTNFADTNLGSSNLFGSSLRHANLQRAILGKANMDSVQANHAQFLEASMIRCELWDADLRGASLDRALLRGTYLSGADLRGCTIRFARLEKVTIRDAVLGPIDSTGATGSFMSADVFWETDGQRQVLDAEQLTAALREAGAGEITAIAPSI